MLEVERDRAVPILFAHFVDVLTLVVGGVVDEDADRAEPLARLLHRGFERGEVGQVGVEKERRWAGRPEPRRKRL